MAKPFNPNVLVARIEAIRRRSVPPSNQETGTRISAGHISIDPISRLALVDNERVQLTLTEWLILAELVKNAGQVVTSQELLAKVWGYEYRDSVKLLRAWIYRLRRKVERVPGKPRLVRTIHGMGYIIGSSKGEG
jgi:two-component system KDP operon response regulator KdpE